jgi:two-component system LytT family sensor kinase
MTPRAAPAPPPHQRTSAIAPFWVFQAVGWAAFGVAMIFSRVGRFPFAYMVVSKTVFTVLGVLASLALRALYRAMLRHNPSLAMTIVVSVAVSYIMASLWTAADNLIDIPIAGAILHRRVTIDSVFQLLVGSVYHAFALLSWSVLYFGINHYQALEVERERSLRAEALAHQARLEALRFQLNPHFLFNTLNAISTLVVEQRTSEAGRMIARLSDFLRLTLERPDADEVPLDDEIEHVRRYLEIEQVRFGDRLAVEIDVAADSRAARVPALVLQPLVENAIRHAISMREDGGRVRIEARRVTTSEGVRLHLSVTDDGPGVAVGALTGARVAENAHPPHGNGGIGLANTRERLRHHFGPAQRLDLRSVEGGGTSVLLDVPFRHGAQA